MLSPRYISRNYSTRTCFTACQKEPGHLTIAADKRKRKKQNLFRMLCNCSHEPVSNGKRIDLRLKSVLIGWEQDYNHRKNENDRACFLFNVRPLARPPCLPQCFDEVYETPKHCRRQEPRAERGTTDVNPGRTHPVSSDDSDARFQNLIALRSTRRQKHGRRPRVRAKGGASTGFLAAITSKS